MNAAVLRSFSAPSSVLRLARAPALRGALLELLTLDEQIEQLRDLALGLRIELFDLQEAPLQRRLVAIFFGRLGSAKPSSTSVLTPSTCSSCGH
jgi:hypothetical protein